MFMFYKLLLFIEYQRWFGAIHTFLRSKDCMSGVEMGQWGFSRPDLLVTSALFRALDITHLDSGSAS